MLLAWVKFSSMSPVLLLLYAVRPFLLIRPTRVILILVCLESCLIRLNGKHVVFGRVLEGADVVNKLQNVAVGGGAKPSQPVVIKDCGLVA